MGMNDFPGVYVIACVPTGKRYVGSALKVLKRIGQHQRALRRGNHINTYLQYAYNKYGAEAFTYEIVSKNPANRFAEEQAWIERLRTFDRKYGFNQSYPVRVNEPHPMASRRMKRHWKDPKLRAAWEADLLKNSRKVSELLQTDPEFAAKISAIRQGQWSDKTRKRLARQAKKKYKDADYRTAHLTYLAAGREKLAERRKDRAFVMRQTKGMIDRWKDPEARALQAKRMAALWKDPVFRAKQAERSRKQIIRVNAMRAAAKAHTRDSLNNGKQEAIEAVDKEPL
jgi:group I intron endonuclease